MDGQLRKNFQVILELEYDKITNTQQCSEQNNTDLVGVTWPGAGGRKSRPRSGSERPRALTLTDGNGCLRHCAGCQQGTLKKPPDGRARQMAIARSKKAEGVAMTSMVIWIADENSQIIRFDRAAHWRLSSIYTMATNVRGN
ncbi:hypothetical protein T03_16350 [Trichinella britovi]|uniref:Uncharacterized protein n=1 Tax=Trichinella britovi TaxID=45882 RepID=A0A0V1C913_TRIBR|nr:hypothetical protein T03_16350 [Trichinella britovi]